MRNKLTKTINYVLDEQIKSLEKILLADVICIDAPIDSITASLTRNVLEYMQNHRILNNKICVILTTSGGDANSTERMANTFRHYYNGVEFLIPDHAYSAGTILCMSGDKIFMNYNSVLGPIDPQVMNKEGRFVPALGYLESIESLLMKAKTNSISEVEMKILKDFDLAELKSYEQARDLSIDLLKRWLVKYKFSNLLASESEKVKLAERIANELTDYRRWKSHGRPLSMETIKSLGLEIENFGSDKQLEKQVMDLFDLSEDYMRYQGTDSFIYSIGYES